MRGTLVFIVTRGIPGSLSRTFLFGTSMLTGCVTGQATPGAEATRVVSGEHLCRPRRASQSWLAFSGDRYTVGGYVWQRLREVVQNSAADMLPIWPESLFDFAALGDATATLKIRIQIARGEW